MESDLEVAVEKASEYLQKSEPPAKLGYGDFALIFALAYRQKRLEKGHFGGNRNSSISADSLRIYIKRNPTIPQDCKLEQKEIEQYIDFLRGCGLIYAEGPSGYYLMNDQVASLLVRNFTKFKSPGLEELAIRAATLMRFPAIFRNYFAGVPGNPIFGSIGVITGAR